MHLDAARMTEHQASSAVLTSRMDVHSWEDAIHNSCFNRKYPKDHKDWQSIYGGLEGLHSVSMFSPCTLWPSAGFVLYRFSRKPFHHAFHNPSIPVPPPHKEELHQQHRPILSLTPGCESKREATVNLSDMKTAFQWMLRTFLRQWGWTNQPGLCLRLRDRLYNAGCIGCNERIPTNGHNLALVVYGDGWWVDETTNKLQAHPPTTRAKILRRLNLQIHFQSHKVLSEWHQLIWYENRFPVNAAHLFETMGMNESAWALSPHF